ncbi:MAG: hypothetical protein IJG15_01010, partial [Lachnospiraceae bacterium]|nr:hypothetical protein [Lachnospiraceae bacterium]
MILQRNRLREFLFRLPLWRAAWSERVKNLVDTRFFALGALCRETAQSSADPSENIANFKAL